MGLQKVTNKVATQNATEAKPDKGVENALKVDNDSLKAVHKAILSSGIMITKSVDKLGDILMGNDLQKAEDQQEMIEILKGLRPSKTKDSKASIKDDGKKTSWLGDLLGGLKDGFLAIPAIKAAFDILKKIGGVATGILSTLTAGAGFAAGFTASLLKSHGLDIGKALEATSKGLYKLVPDFLKPFEKTAEGMNAIAKSEATLKAAADAPKIFEEANALAAAKSKELAKIKAVGSEAEIAAATLAKENAILAAQAAKKEIKATQLLAAESKVALEAAKLSKGQSFMTKVMEKFSTVFDSIGAIFKEGGAFAKVGTYFTKFSNIFTKFMKFGNIVGKIFAPIEAAYYVVTSAFKEGLKAFEDGAGLFEIAANLLMGAGKGALEWILNIPAMLADLVKDYMVAPLMKLFGQDQLAKDLKAFSIADQVKGFIDKIFGIFKNIGEWIATQITKLNISDKLFGSQETKDNVRNAKLEKLKKFQGEDLANKLRDSEFKLVQGISDEDANLMRGTLLTQRAAELRPIPNTSGAMMNATKNDTLNSQASAPMVVAIAGGSNSSPSSANVNATSIQVAGSTHREGGLGIFGAVRT